MSEDRDLGYWLTHPAAATAAVATAMVGSVDMIEPLFAFLTATVTTWFPLLSTLRSVAGVVPSLPTGLFEQLFLIGALAYAGILVADLINNATDDS